MNRINGYRALVLMLGGLAAVVLAQTITGPALEMVKVGELMRRIYPVIIRSDKTLSPQQVNQLRLDVKALSTHIKNTSKQQIQQTETFQLSMQTMFEHLDNAETSLGKGDIRYARTLLRSATTLCSACHTQDLQGRIFTKDSLKVAFDNPLLTADYYYMTRDYPQALAIYRDYIRAMGKVVWNEDTRMALERSLVIFVQINRDPRQAENYLKSLSGGNTDKMTKVRIGEWLRGLQIVKTAQGSTKPPTFKELAGYMKEYILPGDDDMFMVLSEDKRAVGLWIRGMLHRYLNAFPTREETPPILYWLAVIDRALEYNLFYSLADLYLKQCIVGYTDHPYAQHCFNLYKDYIQFSYTGSGGTNIPEPVEEELRLLQARLEKRAD